MRAKETTKEIYKYHEMNNTPITYSSEIREKSAGVYSGKKLADYKSVAIVKIINTEKWISFKRILSSRRRELDRHIQ
jgi:hypothetical protein